MVSVVEKPIWSQSPHICSDETKHTKPACRSFQGFVKSIEIFHFCLIYFKRSSIAESIEAFKSDTKTLIVLLKKE